jgi:hypothetical protein
MKSLVLEVLSMLWRLAGDILNGKKIRESQHLGKKS